VRECLKPGLVEGPNLLELPHMVLQFALGVVPAVAEGGIQEVHVQADVCTLTVGGDPEEGGVMRRRGGHRVLCTPLP
jgi:hypothetical protein